MPRIPIDGLGLQGLNGDTPSFAVQPQFFTDGNNLRPLDNSIQGVLAFEADVDFTWSVTRATGTPLSVTADGIYNVAQVTPTGSNFFNMLAIVRDTDGSATTRALIINENDSSQRAIIDIPVGQEITYTDRYGIDTFVFNEVTVLNAGSHEPLYFSQGSETAGNFNVLPNWFTSTIPNEQVIARKMAQFGGRLVAMNFTGGNRGAATIAFSDPISSLDSLSAVQWTIAATNTAADDIITETPGEVVDGGTLGNTFIAYKSDSVISYREVPSSPFFIPQPLFTDDGILSSRCFVDIGGSRHVVLGNRGVYMHSGSSDKNNISRGRVEQSFLDEMDFTKKDRCFLFNNATDKEVYICFPSRSQTATGCDRAYVYNYVLDAWHKRDIPNLINMVSTQINGQVELFGTSLESATLLQLAKSSYMADGFIEFAKQDLGDATTTKSISALYVLSDDDIQVGLKHLNDLGGDTEFVVSDLKTFDPDTQWKVDFRRKGRYFTFYFRMSGSVNPKLSGIHLDINPERGKR